MAGCHAKFVLWYEVADLYHGIENAKQEGVFRLCRHGIN